MKIIFATGNKLKFEIASNILKEYGVELVQQKIETPEIQAETGKAIAEFSANFASQQLKVSVVKTDVSYHILALNGFPGPFVKFVNKWLSAQDILNLMNGKKDRRIEIVEFLTFATSEGETTTFETKSDCVLAEKITDDSKGTTFDKLIIREGYDVPQNLLSQEQLDKMFYEQVKVWHDLGKYIKKQVK